MLKIGDFSKLTRVTVKTLRHYDQLGLLHPTWTDRYTGYRYYALDQLPRLNRILALKDLGFSLEQVGKLLDEDIPAQELRAMFNRKQQELAERVFAEQERLNRVAERLRQLEQSGRLPGNEVIIKPVPSQVVAARRSRLASLADLPAFYKQTHREALIYLAQIGLRSAYCWMLTQHNPEYSTHTLDFELGLIVLDGGLAQSQPKPGKAPKLGDLALQEHPAIPHAACLLHQRPAQSSPDTGLQEAFTTLYRWVEHNGYAPCGPAWQVLMEEESGVNDSGTDYPLYSELMLPVESNQERKQHYLANPYRKENEMEPRFETRPAFTIVGMRYFGKNQNQEISQLWQTANQHLGEVENVAPNSAAYGLCSMVDGAEAGEFEYVAGLQVSKVDRAPEGMVAREVPEHRYAIFTHVGSLQKLRETYDYIYQTWLPQSGYKTTGDVDFELYNEDFKDFAPDSRFYIYVPIVPAN